MDKETLSHYGWIVIVTLILAVMLAFASPFGKFIAQAVQATTQGLFDVNKNALDENNIEIMGQEFDNMFDDWEDKDNTGGANGESTPTDPEQTECQHTNTTIINASPTYTGDTYCNDCNTVIGTGTNIAVNLNPDDGSTPYSGQVYTYGNYQYCYDQGWCDEHNCWTQSGSCTHSPYGETGWGVRLINDVADPGPMLESINGEPIEIMSNAFYGCTNIEIAPTIPDTIENLWQTFYGCTSLKTVELPSNAQHLSYTFAGCTSLKIAPAIPNSIITMQGAFNRCTSLTTAPDISRCTKLTDLSFTFSGCINLNTYQGSTDANGDFSGFVIPNDSVSLEGTFGNCVKLTVAPTIPSSWNKYKSIVFEGCTGLGY